MIVLRNPKKINIDKISIDPFWNIGTEKELRMHRIHSYPAKFPAFITTKALQYAKQNGVVVNRIADIFCGCGTVAFEAKRNNIDFWGCDINPVATMIACAKSKKYNTEELKNYLDLILVNVDAISLDKDLYKNANERLKYWYSPKQFKQIFKLKTAIDMTVSDKNEYYDFFLCAFSNILKPSSRWLTKSIKPQVDPNKKPVDVVSIFKKQCNFMIDANKKSHIRDIAKTEIITTNFLDKSLHRPIVDMIITSPPYVTSYEYADLHQLSSLWLGYTDDYRSLRNGSIGSLYHKHSFEDDQKSLNTTGEKIISSLIKRDKLKAQAVTKYFFDMQQVTDSCFSMLSNKGLALFVIGNTEYKGVKINNAKHLVESLFNSGFRKISMTKRKITGKILTPYRDKFGQFSADIKSKKIYSEEFIVIGNKL